MHKKSLEGWQKFSNFVGTVESKNLEAYKKDGVYILAYSELENRMPLVEIVRNKAHLIHLYYWILSSCYIKYVLHIYIFNGLNTYNSNQYVFVCWFEHTYGLYWTPYLYFSKTFKTFIKLQVFS